MNQWDFRGQDDTDICRRDGFAFANGFQRIVHGGRGDYVEFTEDQLLHQDKFRIPPDQQWRINSDKAYYVEYRFYGVKIYHQKKPVTYADYKVGYYYVSPIDLADFVIVSKRKEQPSL